jgi:hypothetical protein
MSDVRAATTGTVSKVIYFLSVPCTVKYLGFCCEVSGHSRYIIVFFTNLMHKLLFFLYFNTSVMCLYTFRAYLRSSSGGQNCTSIASGVNTVIRCPFSTQAKRRLCTEHRQRDDCVLNGHLMRVLTPEAILVEF